MQAIVDLISTLFTLVFFAAIIFAAVAVWRYNTLRKLAENVKEAQSNVDIALRKKVSLINRLSEMANQYREGEKLVMLKVSQDASGAAMRDAYQQSGTMLAAIQGMAQRFPELKATDQFKELLPAIDRAESDLQNWRVRCNGTIKDYNSHRSALPHTLYAGMLGFSPARYLELESTESADSMVERPIFSDDGDRVNELLGMAGTRMLGATRTLASHGKLLAEKAATRVQTEMAARAAAAREYHYLDADRSQRAGVARRTGHAVPIGSDRRGDRRPGGGLESLDEVRRADGLERRREPGHWQAMPVAGLVPCRTARCACPRLLDSGPRRVRLRRLRRRNDQTSASPAADLTALAARRARLLGRPLVSGPLQVRGPAALAGNLTLLVRGHRRKPTAVFANIAHDSLPVSVVRWPSMPDDPNYAGWVTSGVPAWIRLGMGGFMSGKTRSARAGRKNHIAADSEADRWDGQIYRQKYKDFHAAQGRAVAGTGSPQGLPLET